MGVMHVRVLDAELGGKLPKLCQDMTGSQHRGMTISDKNVEVIQNVVEWLKGQSRLGM